MFSTKMDLGSTYNIGITDRHKDNDILPINPGYHQDFINSIYSTSMNCQQNEALLVSSSLSALDNTNSSPSPSSHSNQGLNWHDYLTRSSEFNNTFYPNNSTMYESSNSTSAYNQTQVPQCSQTSLELYQSQLYEQNFYIDSSNIKIDDYSILPPDSSSSSSDTSDNQNQNISLSSPNFQHSLQLHQQRQSSSQFYQSPTGHSTSNVQPMFNLGKTNESTYQDDENIKSLMVSAMAVCAAKSTPQTYAVTQSFADESIQETGDLEAFAEKFKQRRIKLGVTQADVGRALGRLKIAGVGSLSQSTICRFESLTLSHNNMIALKPILEAWLLEAEAASINGSRQETFDQAFSFSSPFDGDKNEFFQNNFRHCVSQKPQSPSIDSLINSNLSYDQCSSNSSQMDFTNESKNTDSYLDKKRKRTSITDGEKRSLEAFFNIQPRPSSEKISQIAEKLNLKKNVVRVWFCNQRQKQKRLKFKQVTSSSSNQINSLDSNNNMYS